MATMDSACNNFGVKLLDLCKSSGVRIVNGRLYNDIEGSFTFVNSQCSSVIDYLVTKPDCFNCLSDFSVGPFNEYSDHAELSFSLKCSSIPVSDDPDHGTRYRWDDSRKREFRSGLIGKLPIFNNLVCSLDTSSRECINSVLNDFTRSIIDVADPLFCQNVSKSKTHCFEERQLLNELEWFDFDCHNTREIYLTALKEYNRCPCTNNREHFSCLKRTYKSLCKKKKRQYEKIKIDKLCSLKKERPKQFWNFFKSKSKQNNNIPLIDFKNFFVSLSDSVSCSSNQDADSFCSTHDFDDNDSTFEELNSPFTIPELMKAVASLKRGKALGSDSIMNEYLIEGIDILSSHICDLFNAILESGCFPDKWTEGIIVPIHKKGSREDVTNYRGVTLLSCFSKLFTTLLNNRVTKFCDENNIISDAQFGFKKGVSTTDAIFVLMNIITKYLSDNKRLYCIFVDLKKCFDSINRNIMWYKMHKLGIKGKLLRIIRDIYNKVKSCVSNRNKISDFFEYGVGLRQGEIISPILASLFLEDLELYLQENPESGLSFDQITLIILLFADDMVIFGKSPDELQKNINLLYGYCSKWGLEVNVEKTKTMVFRKRGKLKENESWTYNGRKIESVDDFNYLGTVFHYTGNFAENQEYIVGKSMKALNALLINCLKFKLPTSTLCQLFDAFVGSVLNYACEIWGYSKSKAIERIHLKFCKRILQVKSSTNSMAVYGELGRYPLYISRYIKIIKYWYKLLDTKNIILKTIYKQAFQDCIKGKKNWVYNVKKIFDDYGMFEIFKNPVTHNSNQILIVLKQRMIDCFQQEWFSKINSSSVLTVYRGIKTSFAKEEYLDTLPLNVRGYICKFRISAHSLNVQSGRYANNRIPRNERICKLCNMEEVEDEYHFVLICPKYMQLRKKYISDFFYTKPSMYKLVTLMRSNKNDTLIKLASFIRSALSIRFGSLYSSE